MRLVTGFKILILLAPFLIFSLFIVSGLNHYTVNDGLCDTSLGENPINSWNDCFCKIDSNGNGFRNEICEDGSNGNPDYGENVENCIDCVSSLVPECSDGIDNDADSYCDFGGNAACSNSLPGDPGCQSLEDNDESDESIRYTLDENVFTSEEDVGCSDLQVSFSECSEVPLSTNNFGSSASCQEIGTDYFARSLRIENVNVADEPIELRMTCCKVEITCSGL